MRKAYPYHDDVQLSSLDLPQGLGFFCIIVRSVTSPKGTTECIQLGCVGFLFPVFLRTFNYSICIYCLVETRCHVVISPFRFFFLGKQHFRKLLKFNPWHTWISTLHTVYIMDADDLATQDRVGAPTSMLLIWVGSNHRELNSLFNNCWD